MKTNKLQVAVIRSEALLSIRDLLDDIIELDDQDQDIERQVNELTYVLMYADKAIRLGVGQMRRERATWQTIAIALGTTTQAAQQRFGR